MLALIRSRGGIIRKESLKSRAFDSLVVLITLSFATALAQAQTFTVLYTFTNTDQGWQPAAGLIRDSAGNLYGTTQFGGVAGRFGTIFRLDPSGNETVLHSFAGTPDGLALMILRWRTTGPFSDEAA